MNRVEVNGFTISQFQRCKRIHAIGRTHHLTKWRPQSLLSACLRYAIVSMSNGESAEKCGTVACNYFIAAAKNPGLDVMGINPYTLSMDYCSIIRNVLEYLSRVPLLPLRDVPSLSLSTSVTWNFLAHRDETGELHRWEFVDYLDEDPLARLHSWEVFGDLAAAEMPMTLHIVAIGKRNGSHQESPWCRIFAHPKLAKIYKFKRKKGDPLFGQWKPVYFTDSSENTSTKWVDMMLSDNVIEGLVQHVKVKEVSSEHVQTFVKDVLTEAAGMLDIHKRKLDPRQLPMGRYACDHPYICPHQLYCYGSTSLTLDSVGLYSRNETD